jgi:site-specific DNA-methyltransferase (adenine-specific)
MEVCPNCSEDLRDYGGYKDRMNPAGINLTDVWFDISPVRHAKYKKRKGANELPVRLLDRVIEMSSNPGDLVFDPFGGAGTTYIVSEIKQRRWVGVELGPVDDIIARFASINEDASYLENIRQDYNHLFTDETRQARKRRGLWTVESIRALKENEPQVKLNFEI